MVVAPGSLGEFGVLPGHVPFLTGIEPGELRYTKDGKSALMAVTVGFSEVSEDKASILVDAAEEAHDIDLERARKAMERARERMALDRGKTDIDFARAEIALKRAIARVKVAEKVS
jgi:F-type H+-transporting ATPase subunit epsilon